MGLYGTLKAPQPGAAASGAAPSDRRLKRNIRRIGTVKGLPWYSFEYVWGEQSEGFMSDEVPEEFVIKMDNGYDAVNYAGILGG